jgi:hypothetical protein
MKKGFIHVLKAIWWIVWRLYSTTMILLFGLVFYIDFYRIVMVQLDFTGTIWDDILGLMIALAVALANLYVLIGDEIRRVFSKKTISYEGNK